MNDWTYVFRADTFATCVTKMIILSYIHLQYFIKNKNKNMNPQYSTQSHYTEQVMVNKKLTVMVTIQSLDSDSDNAAVQNKVYTCRNRE